MRAKESESERERERERETDRQTDRQTDRETPIKRSTYIITISDTIAEH